MRCLRPVLLACAVTGATLVAGCSLTTTPASDVAGTSVTLNAHGSCARGSPTPCSWYFQYGSNGQYQSRTPPSAPCGPRCASGPLNLRTSVSGLTPNRAYQYQVCGEGDNVSSYHCVGPTQGFMTATRSDCIYAAHSISALQSFEQATGYGFNCVGVFNSNSAWSDWESPWFLPQNHPASDSAWAAWASSPGTTRRLIITQKMLPATETGDTATGPGSGIANCASGYDNGYATTLAQNLVAAGLGNAVIRLGEEANDSGGNLWSVYPNWTAARFAVWIQCWRNLAYAIKAVPGAHFLLDWSVNNGYSDIPLADWYPGDDVVDVVGVDVYDRGIPTGTADRWGYLYNKANIGVAAVTRFAAAHHKPVGLPEWGLWDIAEDPDFIEDLAATVKTNPVAYQAYFLNENAKTDLLNDPADLAAYVRHFGWGGDLANSAPFTP